MATVRVRQVPIVQCDGAAPTEREFNRYQDGVSAAVARAINYEPAYGTLVRGVALPAAATVKVGHGLGRIPQDANPESIARAAGGTVPAVSVESADATFVVLYSSALGTCNLRVW